MAKHGIAVIEPRPEVVRVVRVAVSTNFNCTKAEWEQLDALALKHPNSEFFVNCNVNTPRLATVNDHPYKVVITANPDLMVTDSATTKISQIDPEKIAFIRVKYVPTMPEHKELIALLASGDLPVVVTLQRWNSKASLFAYTEKHHYEWSHNRFRLHGDSLQEVLDFVDGFEGKVFICDRIGGGCGTCRLCSFLATGKDLKISSIDMSSSGLCQFNCPDCYAKTMQRMSTNFGNSPLIFDKIRANTKQAGRLVHIKERMALLNATA